MLRRPSHGDSPPRLWALIAIPLSILVFYGTACRGGTEYSLPVLRQYEISKQSPYLVGGSSHHLVEATRNGGSFGASVIVQGVKRYAVEKEVIVGEADGGFFIFDTRDADPQPAIFTDEGLWHASLAGKGMNGQVQFLDPDTVAAKVDPRILYPWDYRVCRGVLGMADLEWSLVVQGLGFLIAVVIGVSAAPRAQIWFYMAALGITVNIIAQIVIAGGGPGALPGFVAFPLLYLFGGWIGRTLRRLFGGRGRGVIQPMLKSKE